MLSEVVDEGCALYRSQTFTSLLTECVLYILCFKWMQSTISHLRSISILCPINFYIFQVINFVGVSTKTLYSDQCDWCLELCILISATSMETLYSDQCDWCLKLRILISVTVLENLYSDQCDCAWNFVFWSVLLVLETLYSDQCDWCLKLCILISATSACKFYFNQCD